MSRAGAAEVLPAAETVAALLDSAARAIPPAAWGAAGLEDVDARKLATSWDRRVLGAGAGERSGRSLSRSSDTARESERCSSMHRSARLLLLPALHGSAA